YGHGTSGSIYHALAFEVLQRICHAGSAHAEHEREKLMRENEFVGFDAILCHQQPTRQPFLNRPMSVGERGTARLDGENVSETQKASEKGRTLVHRFAQIISRYALGVALNLDEDIAGRSICSKHDRLAGHALAADDGDFGLPAFAAA